MGLDGGFGQVQPLGKFGIAQASGQQAQHLDLPRSQRRQVAVDCRRLAVTLRESLDEASGDGRCEESDTITLRHQGIAIPVQIVGEVFDTTDGGKEVFTDAATFADADPALAPTSYHIAVDDGVDVESYVTALNTDLDPLSMVAQVGGDDQESDITDTLNALSAMLSVLLVTVAALGVLNSVVLDTHERVHEIGIHKALGMVPRQTISMVITSVVVPGVAGAALGVSLGLAVHAIVVPAMGHSAGLKLPDVVTDVFGAGTVTALGVGGMLIAIAGSLLPAGWAARTRTATALRTE